MRYRTARPPALTRHEAARRALVKFAEALALAGDIEIVRVGSMQGIEIACAFLAAPDEPLVPEAAA